MRKIRIKRKIIARLEKKYKEDPAGNGFQRAITLQKHKEELEAYLSERKFELVKC